MRLSLGGLHVVLDSLIDHVIYLKLQKKILLLHDENDYFFHPEPFWVNFVTLLFYQIEPLKNGFFLVLPSSLSSD